MSASSATRTDGTANVAAIASMDTGKLARTIQATPPTHPSITTVPLTGIATVPGMSMERQALASAVPGMGTERQVLASGPLALVDGNCGIGELPLRNLRDEPLAARTAPAQRSLAMLVEVPVSFGHWKMTTFVAALRKHGITAPLVVDAPTNGEIFLAYLKPLAGVPRSCSGASTGVKVSHTL